MERRNQRGCGRGSVAAVRLAASQEEAMAIERALQRMLMEWLHQERARGRKEHDQPHNPS